ncbi:hypothetical protein TYRP_001570 [Tyrophagus putrescentiae]|nr:hypothetical protein TYRP_001570 [Tyrophagus putrescentiae]
MLEFRAQVQVLSSGAFRESPRDPEAVGSSLARGRMTASAARVSVKFGGGAVFKGGEFWSHQKAYDRRAARVSGSSSRVNDKGGEFQSHWKAYDRRAARKSQSNRFSAEVVLAPRELQ